MDVKYVNPFIDAVTSVMPQLGFKEIVKGNLSVKNNNLKSKGVMILVGMVGDIKGNIVYSITIEDGKKIASTMMMGMPVEELNDVAESALSELSNMLTANASSNLEKIGIQVNISTPTLMYGENVDAKMNVKNVLCLELIIDNMPLEINVALEGL